MSRASRAHTPRSLAAILNPEVPRREEPSVSQHPSGEAGAPTAAAEVNPAVPPARNWRNLRERVFGGEGNIELLLFACGNERFAVPLESVREALDSVEAVVLPQMPAHIRGVVIVGGRPIPLHDSTEFLGVATTAPKPSVLIMKNERGDAGLAVDLLLSSAEVDVASVRRVTALEDAQGAFVGVFFDDGALVSLLDPAAFARGRDNQVPQQ